MKSGQQVVQSVWSGRLIASEAWIYIDGFGRRALSVECCMLRAMGYGLAALCRGSSSAE